MQKFALPIVTFSLLGVILQFKQPVSSLSVTAAIPGASDKSLTQRLIPMPPMPGELQNILVASSLKQGEESKTPIIKFNLGDIPPEEEEIREEMQANLQEGKTERGLGQMERFWQKQVEKYFQKSFSQNQASLDQNKSTLAKLAQQTGRRPAVIYILAQPQMLGIVLVTPDGKPIYKSLPDVERYKLLGEVQTFLVEVTNPRRTLTTSYLPSSQQLYKWIIDPIESELQQRRIDTLIFAFDSGLRSLPVAALHDGHKFLVEKYALGMTLNLSLMNSNYTQIQNSQVLAMGASEFKDKSPLPAVPLELSTIVGEQSSNSSNQASTNAQAGLWAGRQFINEKFTPETLRVQRAANEFQIIHLATHGEFNPGPPGNSYIEFGNGKLSLDKIPQLQLNKPPLELLVLSACKTAVGDQNAQFGFAGMAVQSGVKTVVASLWYVSDQGTLALMTEFYKQLKTAPIKAEALRQAQMAMIRGEVTVEGGQLRSTRGSIQLPPVLLRGRNVKLSHPYYWAAFTMIGSPW